jgi:hypothetical protein
MIRIVTWDAILTALGALALALILLAALCGALACALVWLGWTDDGEP